MSSARRSPSTSPAPRPDARRGVGTRRAESVHGAETGPATTAGRTSSRRREGYPPVNPTGGGGTGRGGPRCPSEGGPPGAGMRTRCEAGAGSARSLAHEAHPPVVRRPHRGLRWRRQRPASPCACPGCGRVPWLNGQPSTCEPKDVRGRQSLPHAWPEPETVEELDIFGDHNPCPCGAPVGGFHHWECVYEDCPWADEHPDDGTLLVGCGCME